MLHTLVTLRNRHYIRWVSILYSNNSLRKTEDTRYSDPLGRRVNRISRYRNAFEQVYIVAGLDVKLKLFADDAKLYRAFSIDSSVDLEVACKNLSIWAELWQLRIASKKCCVHRITNQTFCADSVHCSYVLDGTQLKWSTETRDLGVIIDSKVNFNKHVDVIVHKAHARARHILRRFTSKNSTILIKAFVTYVRPILEYCTPAWSSLTINNINKIEAVQRRFTKRITGLSCINYFDRLHCLGL